MYNMGTLRTCADIIITKTTAAFTTSHPGEPVIRFFCINGTFVARPVSMFVLFVYFTDTVTRIQAKFIYIDEYNRLLDLHTHDFIQGNHEASKAARDNANCLKAKLRGPVGAFSCCTCIYVCAHSFSNRH